MFRLARESRKASADIYAEIGLPSHVLGCDARPFPYYQQRKLCELKYRRKMGVRAETF